MLLVGLLLLAVGCVAVAGPTPVQPVAGVVVGHETLELPSFVSQPRYLAQPNTNAAFHPQPQSQRADGVRRIATIWLENRYLRVQVAPELGGVVVRAVDVATGHDLFHLEGRIKDWIPYWESGVKVCFPWHEHGVRTDDQPASWRLVHHPDGSVSIAMWMEFSRFHQAVNRWQGGRFSDLMLTQLVTLEPDAALFRVRYAVFNPGSYRQGLNLWNDALFPRTHTPAGIVRGDDAPPAGPCDTRFILPAAWVSHHEGRDLMRLDPRRDAIAEYPQTHNSLFAWDIRHGFAGLWYPSVSVNRLRLTDPAVAPGAKLYFQGEGSYKPGAWSTHMYNFIELWGGTSSVFEGIERWIEPGRRVAIDYAYLMTHGIGRAEVANDRVVVHAQLAGAARRIEVVTLRPVTALSAKWDGQPLGEAVPCAPDRPAIFALASDAAGGRLTLVADGQTVLDESLPLAVDATTQRHEAIKAANSRAFPENDEKSGNALLLGRQYRNALGGKGYPDPSVDRGRVLYRDGSVEAAIKCLVAALRASPDHGEGWRLLGAARLEQGDLVGGREALEKALTVAQPDPAAGYDLAVLALGQRDAPEAQRQLEQLVQSVPDHWEGRLLRALVTSMLPPARGEALRQARGMVEEDPADPRALWVLEQVADRAGDASVAATARDGLALMRREPGAPARVDAFIAAAQGRWTPPLRLDR